MKTFAIVLVAVAVLSAGTLANAQTPTVQIYFDQDLTRQSEDCPAAPPGSVFDTMYVVADNFNAWITAIEYQITYPSSVIFLGDVVGPDFLKLGSSPSGISIAYPVPQNAFDPFVAQMVLFQWNCSSCVTTNDPVDVGPHPNSGKSQVVEWQTNNLIEGVGMRSLICATVPVQETTWGKVKSLYR